ncbi:MAG: hydroxyacid dehydrogenase [Candidatus Thermoplasmatota archaeon]|nr:hydroxyacid dehydrogenase [Candidatus Thermoplasmatota archaeon]
MAKIVATDGLSAEAVSLLERNGHEVIIKYFTPDELNSGVLSDFDGVIVRSATKLNAKVIAASSGLRVIARAGVGVDNIDLEAAGNAGIPVVNAPIASTQSVVELTIAHLLTSVRKVAISDRSMRQGNWEKKAMKGSELHGKNLGLVGFGRIAQGVGAVAQALGMNVHAYDPYLPPKIAKSQNTRLHKSVDTLFSNCTHVSIHCNLTTETHHLVNYEMVSKMPGKSPDGIACGNHIVNCARGGIVNENDMLQALNDEILASLALDVFEEEPVSENYELCQHPNFHGTPHIGASTIEAQRRVGLDIAKNVMAILEKKKCDFIVNNNSLK